MNDTCLRSFWKHITQQGFIQDPRATLKTTKIFLAIQTKAKSHSVLKWDTDCDTDQALWTRGWQHWDLQCQMWPPDQGGFLYWLPHKPVDNAAQEPPTSQRLLMDTAGWGLCSGQTEIHRIILGRVTLFLSVISLYLTYFYQHEALHGIHPFK